MTTSAHIVINLKTQELHLACDDGSHHRYAVSTAANGSGERNGSECTPRGLHQIHQKFGNDCEVNTVFVGRRPTGECYTPKLRKQHPERDWILTRILWLTGCEPGRNLGGDVDTLTRYIYVHGCPDDVSFTESGSHGCIRMRNTDVIDLYDRVEVGTLVEIKE